MHQLQSPTDLLRYDAWIQSHPEGSLWQSLEWKTYQEALGREVRIYAQSTGNILESSALVVIDRTRLGLSTWDIPRGPLGNAESLLEEIVEQAKSERCISVFLSPQQRLIANSQKLIASSRHEQPPATRLIDLTQPEDAILAQMKQKGRYNIRLAEKHGVHVVQSTDIDAFAHLAAETARRDGFQAPPAARYRTFLHTLPGAFLLMAYPQNPQLETRNSQPSPSPSPSPIAGLLGVLWNGTGIYYYGASDYTHRHLMAPYLLQWEAIKYCKAQGCHTYDLLGIAPKGNQEHWKANSQKPIANSWTGITRFKEQFGGTIVEYPPEQQIIIRPMMDRLLRVKRWIFC